MRESWFDRGIGRGWQRQSEAAPETEGRMANDHHRSSSIPTIRLSQPLPPLPISLDDIRPRNIPAITIIPYHDDPSHDEEIGRSPKSPENLPPSYEPMYDYLRSHQRPIHLLPPSPQTTFLIPTSESEPQEPYCDEPFVIQIGREDDIFQPPPPSYEELYIEDQNRRELESLVREFDVGSAPAEEICKFVVAMLLIALTVAGVGTAFHWGKLGCSGQRC